MSRLEELPPDQRAVLSLLLRQRKSYVEVATLLGIGQRAVHNRAQAALAVLAPRQARELTPGRREEVGNYLLGQQTPSARAGTRAHLAESAPARAWAHAIAAELAPLAAVPLWEIPQLPPSSRRAGALLLGVIVVVVVVAVILIVNGGGGGGKSAAGGSSHSATGKATSPTAASAAASKAAKPSLDNQISLTPPDPSASKALGLVEVLSEGSQYAFYLAAEKLPPTKGFFYAAWLYNSQTNAEALGRSPAVGANGRMQGGGLLPANADKFEGFILTKETNAHPSQPGPIVLKGAFSLRK
jgi:hypothetical protein